MKNARNLIALLLSLMLLAGSTPRAWGAELEVETDEASYRRGETVTVTIAGGTADGILLIQISDPDDDAVWADQRNFDSDGAYEFQLKIPASWPLGDYTVTVKDQEADAVAQAEFVVEQQSPRGEGGAVILSQGIIYRVNKLKGITTYDGFTIQLTSKNDKVSLEGPDGAEIIIMDGKGNDIYYVESEGSIHLRYFDGPGNDKATFKDLAGYETATIDDSCGSGNDRYYFTFAGPGSYELTIIDGLGNDGYSVGFSKAQNELSLELDITDGHGNDGYVVKGSSKITLGSLTVALTGGAGNDRLDVKDIEAVGHVVVEIEDGSGNDKYGVKKLASLSADTSITVIDAGGNDVYSYAQGKATSVDTVTMVDGEGTDRYDIRTGPGDDFVDVTDGPSKDTYSLDGEKGKDKLTGKDDYPFDKDSWKIKNFED